jgi:hypothetical protein
MKQVLSGSGLIGIGNSFVLGQYATGSNGFAQQLAAYIGGTFNNHAAGSTTTTDATKKALQVLPVGFRRQPVLNMSAIVDVLLSGAPIPRIKGNLRAFLVACFLNDACPASRMTRTGTWLDLSTNAGGKGMYLGGKGLYSVGNANASLEWTFYGDNVVIGGIMTNGIGIYTYQDLAIEVDGIAQADFNCLGTTDHNISYDARVIRGLGAGAHKIKIKAKNASNFTVVDYVGTLVEPCTQSPVFVCDAAYVVDWTKFSANGSQANCDLVNQAIADVVAEFADWDVELIKTNDFYNVATGCHADNIHQNDVGATQLLNAVKDKITLFS